MTKDEALAAVKTMRCSGCDRSLDECMGAPCLLRRLMRMQLLWQKPDEERTV